MVKCKELRFEVQRKGCATNTFRLWECGQITVVGRASEGLVILIFKGKREANRTTCSIVLRGKT